MSGEVERVDGERNESFPASWGVPRGSTFSAERRHWVAGKVRRHILTRKQTPDERRAQLERKRRTP